jgi:hypothetical protein
MKRFIQGEDRSQSTLFPEYLDDYVPVSHPFVERLIGTILREVLDQMFFWNALDLTRKLEMFRRHYNEQRIHHWLGGTIPSQRAGASAPAPAKRDHSGWRQYCHRKLPRQVDSSKVDILPRGVSRDNALAAGCPAHRAV